jgi:hypothetical protein
LRCNIHGDAMVNPRKIATVCAPQQKNTQNELTFYIVKKMFNHPLHVSFTA